MGQTIRLGHVRIEPTGMSGAFHRTMVWSDPAELDLEGVATLTCPNGFCANVFEVRVRPEHELRALQAERRSKLFVARWFIPRVQPYTLTPLSGGSAAFHEVQVGG